MPALSHRRRGRREVASAVDPLSGIAESYRSLRSAVQQLPSRPVMRLGPLPGLPATAEDNHRSPVRNPRVLLFVSGSAGEGKTTSIANLAFAFAEAGRRVIVLDCDFRHPEMHAYLGVPASRGLSDLLAADRQVPLASVLQPTVIAGVQLAQAGGSVEHPGALMGLVAPFVAEAAELADIVLVDAPPALVASDAVDLMPTVESAIVVVREGRTGRGEAERLATLLSQVRVPCLGVVQIAARDAGAAYFRTESSKRRAARRHPQEASRRRGPRAVSSGGTTEVDVDALRARIGAADRTVAVVGQGYVGLSVAAAAAAAGMTVHGIDVDADRIAGLAAGPTSCPACRTTSSTRHSRPAGCTSPPTPRGLRGAGRAGVRPDPGRGHRPDMSFIEGPGGRSRRTCRPGRWWSSSPRPTPAPPSTSCGRCSRRTGSGRPDFLLAYSPERIDPGNTKYGLRNTPRVVGGIDRTRPRLAATFYRQLVDDVDAVSSCRAAEMAKLLENTFRMVNIALVNELATLCATRASTSGRSSTRPPPSRSGSWRSSPARVSGATASRSTRPTSAGSPAGTPGDRSGWSRLAQDINAQMPTYVATRVVEALNEHGKSIKGARILALGVTYKPDVGDIRESAAIEVLAQLQRRAPTSASTTRSWRDRQHGLLLRSSPRRTAAASADCVVLLTPHSAYDVDGIASRPPWSSTPATRSARGAGSVVTL